MKVSVIGPGAMGCLFAARLASSGITTTLVDYKTDRAARLAKSGLRIETADGDLVSKPSVSTEVPSKQDLVIVLTKAYTTPGLKLPRGVPILSLQNGLGNIEVLCELVGSANVLAGTTSEASTFIEEGHVRHTASGITKLGKWTSCNEDAAIEALTRAGFRAERTDSPGQTLWEKVVISAGINPLTALLDVPNGKLLELREARQLIRDLVVEAAKVAATEGYHFSYSLVERAEEVCRETSDNISSMLQDVRAGRQTEIEAITGEILRRGELASLPAPRTRVIWQLLKGLEKR